MTVGPDLTFNGGNDAFVAKISEPDGVVGPGGGMVADEAGTGAAFSVPAGVLADDVTVFISVIADPGVAPPDGFFGPATAFVDFTLVPNPSPLQAPGATITLPLAFPLPAGIGLPLFKFDPATATVVATGIVGTVNAGGATASFAGVTSFSVFVGFQQEVSNQAPVCNLADASPSLLWPPNHKLVTVTIAGVTDPDGDTVTIAITGATEADAGDGTGDGQTSPDIVLQGDTVQLRAERSGRGDGRIYTVHFTADDGQGGTCEGTVQVIVPHDRRTP